MYKEWITAPLPTDYNLPSEKTTTNWPLKCILWRLLIIDPTIGMGDYSSWNFKTTGVKITINTSKSQEQVITMNIAGI